MALTYHPGNGPLSEPLRQVAVGLFVVIAGGLAAWLGSSLPGVFGSGHHAGIVGALSMGVGAFIAAVGWAGWRLRRTWREGGFQIDATEVGGDRGLRRGSRIDVVVRVEALCALRLTRARCTLEVLERRTVSSRPGRRIHRNRVEAPGVGGRALNPGDPLVLTFEQTLATHPPPSSDTCVWQAEVEVKALGAPDYLQKKVFIVQ